MKLQFFIHGLTGGGAERVMATLMNAFVAQGNQVQVVYTVDIESSIYELDGRIEQVFLSRNAPVITSSIFNKIWRRFWTYSSIRKAAKGFQPEAAISFLKANNNDVLLALLGTGIPVVIGDHTTVDRKFRWRTSALSKLLYPCASAITMLTMRDYCLWEKKYKHVFYIPNPCPVMPDAIPKVRKKIVLAAGRVNQWKIKGFDNLMRAWNSIKDDYPEWKCQIAGAFDEKGVETLRNEVSVKEFQSVELLGFRSDIYDLMSSSEIFCLSSRVEGMPMVLLEALNLGCACVATNCKTGPSEMFDDGISGILVNDDDYGDLARKLRSVIENEVLRSSIQSKARDSAQYFSLEKIIAMWNAMLNEIINRNVGC